MLVIVEKGIKGGICHAIYRYAKANNKHKNYYDKNIESSCLMYLDANNWYWLAVSNILPVNCFKWNKMYLIFMKIVIVIKDIFLKLMLNILKIDIIYHSHLPFLSERMKIKKTNKLLCNLLDKKQYVFHLRALKQSLSHGLILKKVHRVIQFYQEAWLKKSIWRKLSIRN